MKQTIFLVFTLSLLLTGCSSIYKTAQTPDDLYYSPAKEVVAKEKKSNENVLSKDQQEYQEYISSNDDRYLRMKVQNYQYWNSLDDYSYWNDSRYSLMNYYYNPYGYGYYNPFYFGWSTGYYPNYLGWNPFYSPYYSSYYGSGWYSPVYVVSNYKNPTLARNTSGSNIFAFQNKNYNNSNRSASNLTVGSNGNTSNSFGRLVRTVFTAPNNNSNNSWSNPVRVQNVTPGYSGGGSSSTAGGSSGGYSSTGSSTSSGRAPRQ